MKKIETEQDALAQLRVALNKLPSNAGIIVEDRRGVQYRIVKVLAIGTATEDPGLVIQLDGER